MPAWTVSQRFVRTDGLVHLTNLFQERMGWLPLCVACFRSAWAGSHRTNLEDLSSLAPLLWSALHHVENSPETDEKNSSTLELPHTVNTTPQMPWEYGAKHVEKWLRESSEMNNYSITTKRIRTTMWKNKTETESSMTQMLMTTKRTMRQRTSPLA